ncbi:MAG: hypothetical protein D6B26_00685 [Spirochaetaceae bacterium]|nr:MAG: hypothetical protein D6B26_00685 [Spirochaetaceae bacterium]
MKLIRAKNLLPVFFILICGTATLTAETANPEKILGDQQFSIQLGGFAPLFIAGGEDGVQSANMNIGGGGALRWNAYLNKYVSLGAELYGSMASNINDETLFQVGLTAAATGYFLEINPISFPVSIDIGGNMMRFQDSTYFGPIIKPGIAALYATDSGWSFGLWTKYWLVPEIYTGNGGPPAADTRFGHFIDFNLTALYHF